MSEPHIKFAVLATDVVLFTVHDKRLKVLLIDIENESFSGMKGLPGGLVLPKETADDAALRHITNKGGIRNVYMEQLYTFSALDRDPRGRVVSVAYMGLVPSSDDIGAPLLEGKGAEWVDARGASNLAYDHDKVLDTAIDRIKTKITYTNLAYNLVPKEFTFSELQNVYEVILNSDIDKRNFRKKILALNLVKGTGKEKRGEANRPAELYTFRQRSPEVVQML